MKKLIARLLAALWFLSAVGVAAAAQAPIVIVPIDDRPVTRQLPIMLGAIAGIPVLEPQRPLLGHYLTPGDPEAIYRWLASDETKSADAFVLSSDMLVYGGLVASRVPGLAASLGYSRLREATALRLLRPRAAFYGFGTVMRLAPTGLPAAGAAASFFAAGEATNLITEYANLPVPPETPQQEAKANRLRARLGDTLDAYLSARRRNLNVDLFALQLTAEGGFDRFVLGQDDAGPQGLHIADLAALNRARNGWGWGLVRRTSIEPGADELAMILEAQAFANRIGWVPHVRVTWSQPGGPQIQDPIEFAPLENTVDNVIRSCGGVRVESNPAIELFIRVKGDTPQQERAFVDAISSAVARGTLVTVADLTFLGASVEEQRALVEEMIARKLAGKLDGFASWNTAANSLGTALPAAIAAGVGRRLGTFDATSLAQFLLDRYADDYAFHDFVRPQLNEGLSSRGINHEFLLPGVAGATASENRALLWPYAVDLLGKIFPGYRDEGMTITLPWDRTFETELDVRLGLRG